VDTSAVSHLQGLQGLLSPRLTALVPASERPPGLEGYTSFPASSLKLLSWSAFGLWRDKVKVAPEGASTRAALDLGEAGFGEPARDETADAVDSRAGIVRFSPASMDSCEPCGKAFADRTRGIALGCSGCERPSSSAEHCAKVARRTTAAMRGQVGRTLTNRPAGAGAGHGAPVQPFGGSRLGDAERGCQGIAWYRESAWNLDC